MAIVADKSGASKLSTNTSTPNRQMAGTPIGVFTPLYPDELVLDTTGGQIYRAVGLTNIGWMPVAHTV